MAITVRKTVKTSRLELIKTRRSSLKKAMLQLIVELIAQCELRYRNRVVHDEIDGIQSLDEINRTHES